MNEQLQKELAAWLSKLREATDAGASFAIEQAPLVIQEKLLLGRVSTTVMFLLACVAAVACVVMLSRHVRHVKEQSRGNFDPLLDMNPAVIVPACACGVFAIVFAGTSFSQMLKVWLAPRIYIIDWLASLAK